MSLSNTASTTGPVRPILARAASNFPASATDGMPAPPVTAAHNGEEPEGVLELADGSAFRGISFGAEGKSVAGECVFQTGACNIVSTQYS
jgi:carbamoyl-phosphate synthase / aspartate carbamoyltransferase